MKSSPFQYFALNKPFGVLSQFSSESGHPGIADLNLNLPKDVWPCGRLDRDSEGLIILTNDLRYRHELTDPNKNHPKKYWVQVEGIWTAAATAAMGTSMTIRTKGKNILLRPAQAKMMESPMVWDRMPPVRFRQNVPTSWVEIHLLEGKNRQVRRMTAQVGFPTLRLIRQQIGELSLLDLNLLNGHCLELTSEQAQLALL